MGRVVSGVLSFLYLAKRQAGSCFPQPRAHSHTSPLTLVFMRFISSPLLCMCTRESTRSIDGFYPKKRDNPRRIQATTARRANAGLNWFLGVPPKSSGHYCSTRCPFIFFLMPKEEPSIAGLSPTLFLVLVVLVGLHLLAFVRFPLFFVTNALLSSTGYILLSMNPHLPGWLKSKSCNLRPELISTYPHRLPFPHTL